MTHASTSAPMDDSIPFEFAQMARSDRVMHLGPGNRGFYTEIMTDAPGDPDLRDRRLLLVEDDPTVAEVARNYLRKAGFLVDEVADGFQALESVAELVPDLVILDRKLPGIDGTEVCRRLRSFTAVPVLMLTALSATEDRIDGLESGADDYLTKPFSPRELVLRVQSILKRTVDESTPEAPFRLGPFHLDVSGRRVSRNEIPLEVSAREFDLLAFFLKHPHQVFDRETLLRSVWGWEIGDPSTITVTVRRLREKIEDDPSHAQFLSTVWGAGYRFDVEEELR
ncbi:DNA-binding response regulator, OmpR family, contains REC and winged-helix (wHTH) domain [Brevibacterium aurantiacum]|uniref:DNA-binding response regulator, OmpR family, contains REC and winged-helix (WHTH) domain n=2 Tax=Brevibacterium aurantiacum TaxID=273384 RepID=A0A2H1HYV7_BREAU|nr:DNA-binding response regulator, OmpR family, contains REC and winged-helix (wHTH) domain [Brevibacterium aurantiacum]